MARRDEVVVDVTAASLNFPDVLMCRGEYQVKPPLPFTPGAEVAASSTRVGDGVDGVLVGERVLAIPQLRRRRVHRVDDASRRPARVFPIPDSMPFAAAAPRCTSSYQTGHLALHRRAHLQPGETLLVHAGAGGVGSRRDPARPRGGRARRSRPRAGRRRSKVCREARCRPRARLPRARLRRRGEGVHRRARRRRDLRPGRRRHLRPLDEVHRVRGPHPHHRLHRRSLRRGAHESRPDQELLGRRRALGSVQRGPARSSCTRRTTR